MTDESGGVVSRSQDGPALLSWRQLTYTLLAMGTTVTGFWLQAHLADVDMQAQALLANQNAIIKMNEQIKNLSDGRQEWRQWRDEEGLWRMRIEAHVEMLMEEAGARVRTGRLPRFGRESQVDGTTSRPQRNPPWDH